MNTYPNNHKIALVVPTVREESIKRFLEEWENHIKKYDVRIFIIEDNPEPTFDLNFYKNKFNLIHYSWLDFKKELGENSWIIPRRNASVRSFGFYMAYKNGFDIIVTLDDDCYPLDNYIKIDNYDYFGTCIKRLYSNELKLEERRWEPTVLNIRPRGFPYRNLTTERIFKNLNIILNHGLWANIPDLDAPNQLLGFTVDYRNYITDILIPPRMYFPMCGMNIAFKKEAVPALYFLLMNMGENDEKYPYDRFDDIWAGVFFKKICDHLGYHVVSGHPIIWHDRQSDVFRNLQKEAKGIEMNEKLWKIVDEIQLEADNFADCYKELANKLPLNDEYFSKLKRAMTIWADLF